ncbi:MAG: protein kinase [Rhabdochlamydiaceae bacterium]|nr:protein kinase [Rhabdochlamydiaceae bacterium]
MSTSSSSSSTDRFPLTPLESQASSSCSSSTRFEMSSRGAAPTFSSCLETASSEFGLTTEDIELFQSYLSQQASYLPTCSYYLSKKDGSPIPFLCEATPTEKRIYLAPRRIEKGVNSHIRLGMDLQGRVIVLKMTAETGAHITKKGIKVNAHLATLKRASEFFVYGPSFKYTTYFKGSVVDRTAFILPYFSGGHLFSLITSSGTEQKVPSNKLIYPIALQMAKAVEYLHKHGIVHGDLKPENFLRDHAGKVFLADFGLSSFEGDAIKTGTGAAGYIDPDDFTKPPREMTIASCHRDIWALGACYALFKRLGVFQNFSGQMAGDYHKLADISTKSFEWYKGEMFPNRENDSSIEFVIDHCLKRKPKDRISIRSVVLLIEDLIQDRTSKASLKQE